jgi:hypothetical protein
MPGINIFIAFCGEFAVIVAMTMPQIDGDA